MKIPVISLEYKIHIDIDMIINDNIMNQNKNKIQNPLIIDQPPPKPPTQQHQKSQHTEKSTNANSDMY